MSDPLRTDNANGRRSARSHPALSCVRVVVLTVLLTGTASAVPALAQAQTHDGPIVGPTVTNPNTTTNPATGTTPGTGTSPGTSQDPDSRTSDPDPATGDPDPGTGNSGSTDTKAPSNQVVDVVPAADKQGPSTLLLLVIALAALLAGAVSTRAVAQRILRKRRRLAWQLKARGDPPRRPCSQRDHYCQKTSISLKPGIRDIAYLELHAHNGDAKELETRVSGRLVESLNSALVGYRRERKLEPLRTSLLPTAGLLVGEIESWLPEDAVEREITTEAHLTAAEVEYEFTLYRCSKGGDGPAWEKEDEWQASLEQEEDQDVARLQRPRPLGEDLEGLSAQLANFVTRVDGRPGVTLSSESSTR